ncbi:MAG: hypothetical protein WD226_09695 [Planctomycetota bacterium]
MLPLLCKALPAPDLLHLLRGAAHLHEEQERDVHRQERGQRERPPRLLDRGRHQQQCDDRWDSQHEHEDFRDEPLGRLGGGGSEEVDVADREVVRELERIPQSPRHGRQEHQRGGDEERKYGV